MKTGATLLLAVGFGLLAASPERDAVDRVRSGNAAADRGDFTAALDLYRAAEDRTTDPGLVAYNEAVALYRQGLYREAELHFRRAQEDAAGGRLAALEFGLGNCLVRQSRGSDPRLLREAVRSFERCAGRDDAPADLRDDARHNLELARLLLQKARDKRGGDRPDTGTETDDTAGDRPDDPAPGDPSETARRDPRGRPQPVQEQSGRAAGGASPTDAAPPGKGNLPPIADDGEGAPLTAEDAAEHVRQASARIRHEQTQHRQQRVPPTAPGVRDW